jgi:hypothetical protein
LAIYLLLLKQVPETNRVFFHRAHRRGCEKHPDLKANEKRLFDLAAGVHFCFAFYVVTTMQRNALCKIGLGRNNSALA